MEQLKISNLEHTRYRQVIKFISLVRESHPEMINIYTQGSCFNFFLILKEMFPESIAYYDQNHVITKIKNKYFDITGEVIKSKNYKKFITSGITKKSKLIKQLHRDVYKNESCRQKK